MKKRDLLALRPSPAMAVALVALFSSLVGGAAAATLITGDGIARNAIAKKHIKANAVRSAKVKDGSLLSKDFKAGQLGVGATGAQGLRGAKGDTGDTGPAGPMDASLQKKTAESGQVFSGQIADHFSGNSNGNPFMILADSYPVPLPAGTPSTTVEYVPGAFTASCPGPGQSSPARLCVYQQGSQNLSASSPGHSAGSNSNPQRRYGFALDVIIQTNTSNGYLIANWAYQVP